MLEDKLRGLPQKFLINPSSAMLLAVFPKINPNAITLLAGIAGLTSFVCMFFGHNIIAVCFLWMSGYLDMLDGTLARKTFSKSSRGIVYDIVMDRIVEFMLIFGLFLIDRQRAILIILMLGSILLCVTSFLVVGIITKNNSEKGFHYSQGLMERAEAFIFFSLMILFPSYFECLSVVFIALVLYTAILRVYEFRKQEVS